MDNLDKTKLNKKIARWRWPDVEVNVLFTESLNACLEYFDWLWICSMEKHEGIFYVWEVGHPQRGVFRGTAEESAALAFCTAIERMIDGG